MDIVLRAEVRITINAAAHAVWENAKRHHNHETRLAAMLVLGIETSCDETAAAVVRLDTHAGPDILSDIVLSQMEEHSAFGGVVPEIAARAHIDVLDGVIAAALAEARIKQEELDAIAATAGPGLIGGLLVGTVTARSYAWALGKPYLAVNHLEGHALTARLTDDVAFPFLLLLVSGGHTQLMLVHGVGDYERIGKTIDDALGEAFDKTAKILGLGYPGGPAVEARARKGDPDRFSLPRPLKGRKGADFSFAGLKTALRQTANAAAPLTENDVDDLAASFQAAAIDCLEDRTRAALNMVKPKQPTCLVVAGGVAANAAIAKRLYRIAGEAGLPLIVPPKRLCGDNAVMIAWAAIERLRLGLSAHSDPGPVARARWPLDSGSQAS